jgi:hypothetical protein
MAITATFRVQSGDELEDAQVKATAGSEWCASSSSSPLVVVARGVVARGRKDVTVKRLIVGATPLALLSRCGGATASSSTNAAPTPTANVAAAAKTAYLVATQIVGSVPTNPSACATSPPPPSTMAARWREISGLVDKFRRAVSAITFPASMKADVGALISAYTKVSQLASTLSNQANPNADTLDSNAFHAASTDATAADGVDRATASSIASPG